MLTVGKDGSVIENLKEILEKYLKGASPKYYPPVENLLDLIYEHYTENNSIAPQTTEAGKDAKRKEKDLETWLRGIAGMDVLVDDYGGDISLCEKIMDRHESRDAADAGGSWYIVCNEKRLTVRQLHSGVGTHNYCLTLYIFGCTIKAIGGVKMKQVEGVTKEEYIEECKNEGGVPILYANMQEAVIALCEYTRTRKYNEFELSEENAEAGIRNSSNCDWIMMDDGSVLWRSYPKIEEERAKSGNVKLRACRKKAGLSQSQLAEKAGISVRVYQNYEQGVRGIEKAQLSVLLKICIALECEMSDIL